MSVDLSDEEILSVVRLSPRSATYVFRNMLASPWHTQERPKRGLKTSSVLTRLKRMERQGIVRRVPTSYATMICWEPAS